LISAIFPVFAEHPGSAEGYLFQPVEINLEAE
jgi:hypothetical protein